MIASLGVESGLVPGAHCSLLSVEVLERPIRPGVSEKGSIGVKRGEEKGRRMVRNLVVALSSPVERIEW